MTLIEECAIKAKHGDCCKCIDKPRLEWKNNGDGTGAVYEWRPVRAQRKRELRAERRKR